LLAVRSIAVRSSSGMLSSDSRPQSVKMRISRFSQASIAFFIYGVILTIFISERLSSTNLEASPSFLIASWMDLRADISKIIYLSIDL